MEYIEFDIVDVARRCGIPIDSGTLGREQVDATCPFCGDNGRGRYHLGLKTDTNQYYCVLCGEHGNSVTLYAQRKGVSNRQAVRELKKGCKVYPLPGSPEGKPQRVFREPKSVEERDAVYRDMLSFLPLAPTHRDNLRKRGLSDEQIVQGGYRTLPSSERGRRRLAQLLSDCHDLAGIPGFYQPEPGVWSTSKSPGILIPIRDIAGRIQGFQIRMDEERDPKKRYCWFSTKYHKEGTQSHSPIHLTGDRSAKVAYLTEGALKGDAASFLGKGRLFICVAGVNSLKGLPELLKSLKLEKLIVCVDMDKVYKPNVLSALKKMEGIANKLRLHTEFPNWDPCLKGVDDFFLACTTQGYKPRRFEPTPISNYLEKVWAKTYPDCDRDFIHLCPWEAAEQPLEAIDCKMPTQEEDIAEIERYRQALRDGAIPFPPLVCINGAVAEGRNRYWALRMEGREKYEIYQNRPWQQAG